MINKNKMAVQNIPKLVWGMSAPPLISMFLQYSYNFIDTAFVANISEEALTAISYSFPVTTLMIALSIWLGVGVNVLVANYLGRDNQKEADYIASLGLLLSFMFGILIMIFVRLVFPYYLDIYIKDENIKKLAMDYMIVCSYMQVPNMMHIAIQKILQATGNMWAPMICQSIGAVFNIVFDPIMIFGWSIFPAMGIKGAALSTVLGYTLSLMIISYIMFFRKQKVKITYKGFILKFDRIKDMLLIGLPSFILNVVPALMSSISNYFITLYSVTAVAFYGAYYKIQHMIIMTLNGLIQGVVPILSFNYGAKNYNRLKKVFFYGIKISILMTAIGTICVILFSRNLLSLFKASDDMINLGIPAMRIMGLVFVPSGISILISSLLQSTGNIRDSIMVNLLRQLLLLIPIMWVLSKLLGLYGIWISFLVAEIITMLIAMALYRKRIRY